MESAMETPGKILIIDDTISIINMVKTALLSEKHQVLVATSGTKGIQSAILAQPDLILLDILMPEMDGYETAEKLKKNEKTQHIPIIFMSALSETFDKVKAFQTGAVDYITKPINVDELLVRAKNHISHFRLQKQLININEYLDETVKERTEQLNQKNQELHSRNEILQATEEELKATNDELYNLIGQLEESEFKYRELTENLPDVIMTIDRDHRIIYANRTLIGQKQEQIIGKKIYELDPDKNSHPTAISQIESVFKTGKSITYERYLKSFSNKLYLDVRLSPIRTGNKIDKLLYIISDITDKKKAEEALKKEQTRATNILIGTNAGTWEWDLKTNEVKIDERWADIIGYNLDELEPVTMETWKNSLHPDDFIKAEELLNKHFAREIDYYDAIFRQKHKKGHWVWVNARGKVIEYTPDGRPSKMYGTHLNMTEQKLAEEELRKSEERIKLLFNSSNDAIFMHEIGENKIGKFIEVNNIACERFEYSREEFLQLSPNDIDSSEPLGNRLKIENKLLEAGHGIYEVHHITKSGNVIPSEVSTRIFESEGKKFALSVVRDITERKLNEKKLEDSYTKFKTLADYTYDWEYWKDVNNNFIYISPSSERISGYKPEEFSENKNLFSSIIFKEDKKKWAKHEKNSSNQIACESPMEFRIKTKQGKIKWINHLCRPVYDSKGNYIGNRGTNRDITVQKLSQIALTESELRFKQLADLAMEGILIHKKGVALNINKSLLNITGYKEDELLGKDLIELLVPEKHKSLALSKMALKKVPPYEIEIKRNDGTLIPVELSARSFSENDLNFRVTSIRDITEQKQMRQRILNTVIQTEEEERKRVAQELHDGLGPVLSTVKLYTQTYFSSENEKFKEKIKEQLLNGIDDALEQVSTISNNLSPHVLNDFGLKVAIQKFLEKVKRIKKINVDYIFDYMGSINSDVEITLYRVSIELINNTVKHAEATKIEISVTGNENQIILEYKDNGKGFDFDKVKLKKRGMGLFNIVNRIKSLGGEVEFIKQKEKGIKYFILLPNIQKNNI